mgnify:FL=1
MTKACKFIFNFSLILVLSAFCGQTAAGETLRVANTDCQLIITPVSDHTLRITLKPYSAQDDSGHLNDGPVLVRREWPAPLLIKTDLKAAPGLNWNNLKIQVKLEPLTITVTNSRGKIIQELVIDKATAAVHFLLGDKPLLGLGGGGQGLDRRGLYDPMDNGHRSGEYQIYGSRLPVPFLIGTDGWALFFHRPYNGAFDLRANPGVFVPSQSPKDLKEKAIPLDLFLISASSPEGILSEYTSLTGKPALPPKWALGYMQSHRTITSPEVISEIASTFREKKLPCDALIYLGTGYCPSGWNLGHGSFEFNPATFNQPEKIINQLHQLGFKVILHINNPPVTLHGEFPVDKTSGLPPDHLASYWEKHRPLLSLGIDGWWPDDGDVLPVDSRLSRHLIYYQGPLADQPGKRPFSLHRTGYAGMQRYGGWLWSGDVFSLWDTLAAHVAVGLNSSLSATPFWGTDIGGFTPTRELTGELYVRWFQFASFCPLFRSHGRQWYLHRPWGWNTGDFGPMEVVEGHKGTGLPDPEELHNDQVEPICRQYLELRYRLLPYNYTLVREAVDRGLPLMRALWVHYPDDPEAARCGDEYLWGKDILVAPVVRKGATSRTIYLPAGVWYDFWSNRREMGGQVINRYVDLSTMPIYIRAGAIIPFGPVIQYVNQPTDQPLTWQVYTGDSGDFVLYEDDGISLDYLKGQGNWIHVSWNDRDRLLTVEPDKKTKMNTGQTRTFQVVLLPERTKKTFTYSGKKIEIKL